MKQPGAAPPYETHCWHAAWKSFWTLVASDLHAAACKQIAEGALEPEEGDPLAQATIEHLAQEVGLDSERWFEWVAKVNAMLPGDTADSQLWPHQLPTPPEEPPHAAIRLVKQTSHHRLEGWAASWILYHLSLARAVRRLQAR
jgi:hypothetical protein